MTRLFLCFCLFVFVSHDALSVTDMRIQMLDAQIANLECERAKKLTELQECEKQAKGFKIAGLSSFALTGVGIYANVKLNDALKKANSKDPGGGGNSKMVDHRSQEDKNCDSMELFLELGSITQEQYDEACGNNN